MEKIIQKPFKDKDYMRMAMLKHEETFREQVYELHRLYQIQKMLMDNIGHSHYYHYHNQQRQKQVKAGLRSDGQERNIIVESTVEESEIELTLGLGPSISSQSLSSSSTGSTQTRKTSPNDIGERFEPGLISNNGQQTNPPWMFQALSLKLS